MSRWKAASLFARTIVQASHCGRNLVHRLLQYSVPEMLGRSLYMYATGR